MNVAVIGGGPAGSICSGLLAKKGNAVTLFERNEFPVRKVCGEYLCPAGVSLFKKLGLLNELERIATPIVGMKIVLPWGAVLQGKFPFSDQVPGYSVQRKDLDGVLLNWAKSQGVTVKSGMVLSQLKQNRKDDQWALDFGNHIILKADFVIGADGRHSTVSRELRNSLGQEKKSKLHKRVALHTYFPCEAWNGPFYGEMHLFSNGAYIGLDPIYPKISGRAEWNFSLVCDAAEIKKNGSPEATISAYIQKSADLSARFQLISDQEIFAVSPVCHFTKTVVPAPYVALIGDAAGFLDPLTGEGIFQAAVSAEALANSLIECSDRIGAQGVYKKAYQKNFKYKARFNRVLQFLIYRQWILKILAPVFMESERRIAILLGVIGNVYSLRRCFLGILKEIFRERGDSYEIKS